MNSIFTELGPRHMFRVAGVNTMVGCLLMSN